MNKKTTINKTINLIIKKFFEYIWGIKNIGNSQTNKNNEESDWLPTHNENSKVEDKIQVEDLKEIVQLKENNEQIKPAKQKSEAEEALETFCSDLTSLAREGKLTDAFGRENEVDLLMQILMRHKKNNALLIGEAGVGKSTIVEALAYRIANNYVPASLSKKRVLGLQISSILTGTKYRGMLEEKLENLVDYLHSNPDVILFVDEFHMVMGGQGVPGVDTETVNIANVLKPALSRSTIQVIGATTTQEYSALEKDQALHRRFQIIQLAQPSKPQTFEILKRTMPKYELFHKVVYSDEALNTVIDLTDRFISDKCFPDKAIDILDLVASKKSLKNMYATKTNIAQPITSNILRNIIKLQTESTNVNDLALFFLLQQIERAYTDIQKRMAAREAGEFPSNKVLPKNAIRVLKKLLGKNIERFLFPALNQNNVESSKILSRSKVSRLETLKPTEYAVLYNYLHDERTSGKNGTNNSTFLLTSKLTTTLLLFVKWLSIINQRLERLENVDYNYGEPYNICVNPRIASLFDDFKINQFIAGTVQSTNKLSTKKVQTLALSNTNSKKSNGDDKTKFGSQTEELTNWITKIKPIFENKAIILLNPKSNLDDLEFSENDSNLIFEFLTNLTRLHHIENPYSKSHKRDKTSYLISAEDVADTVSSLKGVPLQSVTNEDSMFLKNIETNLHGRVIGQYEAVNAIGKAIKRSRLGISSKKRPIGSFLFCGPTGVGKTEIAKALAAQIFYSEENLIRFDMSEYHDSHTVSRLIGSPPGYVGSEEGGKLSTEVRNRPYSVVLFDEIEKAHKSVLTILLQVLDDGILTDNQGHTVSFKNTIIICTSNVGARKILDFTKNLNKSEGTQSPYYYGDDNNRQANYEKEFEELMKKPVTATFMQDLRKILADELARNKALLPKRTEHWLRTEEDTVSSNGDNSTYKALKELVFKELQKEFLPEWLNRFDDIIVFTPLKKTEIFKVCNLMINNLCTQLKENDVKLTVTSEVKKVLVERGYDPQFGARPLRREISNSVESLVAEFLLQNSSKNVEIFLSEDGQLKIRNN